MLTDLVAAARRHYPPEIKVDWKWAPGTDTHALKPWPAEDYQTVGPLQAMTVQVAVCNVGGPAPGGLLCNLVAPVGYVLTDVADLNAAPLPSTNAVVGNAPEYRVTYFSWTWPFEPGVFYSRRFYVSAPNLPASEHGQLQGLLFDAANARFNATGRALLPLPCLDEEPTVPWSKLREAAAWPPVMRRRVTWRRAEAADPRVLTGAGGRQSLRSFQVGDPPDLPGPVRRGTFPLGESVVDFTDEVIARITAPLGDAG